MADQVCPRCDERYTEYPALSRRGNVDICSACGEREGWIDYTPIYKLPSVILLEERLFHKKIGEDYTVWLQWKRDSSQ